MEKSSLVGVVTVTFNSGKVVHGFIDSVLRQSHAEFVLYVVDNASSDETLKLLSGYEDSRIMVIPNQVNVGVAEGNNVGIRAALKDGCTSVLLVNNDTEFDSDLVSKMLAGLEAHQCDMVVPKILYFDQPDKIWCAGGTLSRLRGSAMHFGGDQKDDGSFDRPRAINYSPTCCMLIKREVFTRVGLMDSNYFVYFDDTDFCQRAYQAGVRFFYLPSARLLHKVGSLTGGSESDFSTRYGVRNRVYYLLKTFPQWQSVIRVSAYHVYILVKYLFVVRRPKSFWVAQKAFWEGICLSFSRAKRTEKDFASRTVR
jgi:GT2 family glycosyltransferase